ncbi:hypothetical protein [Oceanobacillus jeddahense]|uniref:hypothetical protein n=1 Tax=Oceanobacillus jeddahense TaxID=1462527 RepID=UPI0005960295|nr:hypothetical protein [Oceanobacillus jeddahense]
MLNILIILFGSIPIIPLLLFLATLGIGSDIITIVRLAVSGLGFIMAIISVIFNAIYYLSTLIYYSNWKPIILLLNFFISWTILGWFLLLLIAHMSNKSYAEREKLRHDMNQTA